MTREEYNEYRYIRKSLRGHDIGLGCQLTIRTDASHQYKQALNDFYTSLGFHPASIRVDTHYFDDKERLVYIYGRTWDCNGETRSWEDLYSAEEKAGFNAALN